MSDCTVYIDEAGDLGFQRGTRWFVLSAVVVDKAQEPIIRATLSQIKSRLNINYIHLRKITDFYKRAYITKELSKEIFTYMNVVVDTSKLNLSMAASASIAYNYTCRMLLERVSWYLRDNGKIADVILSARGTSRDQELIQYIKQRLIPYTNNEITGCVFDKISAKTAPSWDLLQLADVCATTMFSTYEVNTWGFCTPCFSRVLMPHLYMRNGRLESYGLKYFDPGMKPDAADIKQNWPCIDTKNERTPGATTT